MSGVLPRRAAVAAFLAFAVAYFFAALLRAITGTLAPTLAQEFALQAGDLGLLAGGYFFGFAATQLPLGRWLDRHGPRAVSLGFLGVAVAGCLVFSAATGFAGLLAGRVLFGAGVGACLMAPLMGFRRWLGPTAQLRANAWMLMTGSLGMVAATLPVQWLVPVVGWRPLFWGLAVLLVLSMGLLAVGVPRWPAQAVPESQDAGYGPVWRHPYFQRLAPLGFVVYGGMIAVQTLWAGPWMLRVAGRTPLEAATGLFWINVSMLGAFWVWGLASPWLLRRYGSADPIMAAGLPWHLAVLAGIVLAGGHAGGGAWALYCVASTFVSLTLPAVAQAFPQALAGRALSAFNLVVFGGVFAVQWGIGLAVDAALALGLGTEAAFQAAMALYWACSAAAYAWFLRGMRGQGRRHNAQVP
jgi:MFS family permease